MKFLASVLIALGCLLAMPYAASAATFTVDSIGDQKDEKPGEGCKTSVNTCTLRAAIEVSNESSGVTDEIKFSAAFNGEMADTISPETGLPTITDAVTVDGDGGGQCATAAGVNGPCVGVKGPAGTFPIRVEDDGVTIEGLAVTEGLIGISVINESTDFIAHDNWVGVKLDGTAGANGVGIFIDPGSDGATIGGTAPAARNVIANNGAEGLDIEGASSAAIQGNYFGVKPDGVTAAANAKNIEVTDSTASGGFEAVENEIGATAEGEALETAACDGGCNVVSGASIGIDLQGNGAGQNEDPASGPTVVHGNHVGLNAAGTSVIANGTYGIFAGAADEATIGGPEVGDENFIAGGGHGIYHENGDGFQAIGNVIGLDASVEENPVTPPSTVGIFVFTLGTVDQPIVSENLIRMVGGIGIEQKFGGTAITENLIVGGSTGIFTLGDGVSGNAIEDNAIVEPEANGILIENDLNEVLGNGIFGAGAAGIRVQNPSALVITTGNLIGGDVAADENTLSDNGGDAIEIVDTSGSTEEDSENEVARNNGELNEGLFIDLVGSANDGIQPPKIDTAKLDSAGGSGAVPGATVRVFRKATTSPGEIESFLGAAIADGSGNWSVTYVAAVPGETQIAATQTNPEGGTSELAFAKTEKAPAGGSVACLVSTECLEPSSLDRTPPQTKIRKGPKAKTNATTVKFKFSSSEPGSTFECKLDKKPFKRCKSPKKYKGLKPGKHVFKVRAVDKAGNKDPTPAKRKFKILS